MLAAFSNSFPKCHLERMYPCPFCPASKIDGSTCFLRWLFSWSSVAIGLAFGIVSVLWLGFIFNDTVIEITLTLAISYIVYFTVRSFTKCNWYHMLLDASNLCINKFFSCKNWSIHAMSLKLLFCHPPAPIEIGFETTSSLSFTCSHRNWKFCTNFCYFVNLFC